jgi:hypothetical protein
MSGETEAQQSGWTTDTLHAHITSLFDAVWREMELIRTQMAHDFRLQDERMARQWGEQELRTRTALDAHDTALQIQRETSLREVQVAAETSIKAIDAALTAQKEAVTLQAEALRQYDSKQNEWRGALNDLGARAMPRSEAEAAINRATDRIQELVTAQQHLISRSESDAVHARLSEQISELGTRLTTVEALARGAQGNKTAIIAAIGVLGVLVSIVVVVANLLSGR